MRVALPVWNGRVAPVFDTAGWLMIVDMTAGRERERRLAPLERGDTPTHRARYLAELGVTVLICGAISRPLAGWVSANGALLIPGVAGPVEEVLRAYLAGRLAEPGFRMPGSGEGSGETS